MKSRRARAGGFGLWAILWLLAGGATAHAELAVPALTGRVVDSAALLTPSERTRVEQAIQQLEEATGGQMAVLAVPTLGDDALESFSIRVAEAWKIGHRDKDDGALLLVVKNDRLMRLEIGYGWEGAVTDARAGDIIRGMAPFFRAGRFGDGVLYAVQQVQEKVTGSAPAGVVKPPAEEQGQNSVVPFIVVVLVVLLLSYASHRSRRGYVLHGGSYVGGGFGGGGFSGGGGSFGGGGASGRW